MHANVGCSAVRDASYLNWKYTDRSDKEFIVFDVLRESKLVASVVLSMVDANDDYSYKRAVILDMVCPHFDRSTLWAVFEQIVRDATERGAHAVHAQASYASLVSEMLAFGFVRREGTRHLLAAIHESVDPAVSAAVFEGSGWWSTLADSDMDIGIIGT